jgi:hypothetical protein
VRGAGAAVWGAGVMVGELTPSAERATRLQAEQGSRQTSLSQTSCGKPEAVDNHYRTICHVDPLPTTSIDTSTTITTQVTDLGPPPTSTHVISTYSKIHMLFDVVRCCQILLDFV